MAICYDFDGTLAPGNMQEHDFIPGVTDWFPRVNAYALSKGVNIRHFIISSGLREMIEGTKISGEFERIFASGFMYDEKGTAVWPALAVNYTTKTQFLFRINKGSLEVYDNSTINKRIPKEERSLPFSNMVYIGDGETDIPCFRLVENEGGAAIAVYEPENPTSEAITKELRSEGRVSLIAAADYRKGSMLDESVRAIVDRIEASSRISRPRL
jgi:hypothetical protein